MNWNNKRVLITGAGGFIGSHLAEQLCRQGARVRALVHYNSLGHRGWLDRSTLAGDMEIVAGEVVDRDSVREAMRGCEVVFHLAALIPIPYSYRAPASYVQTNIEGTLNVLQNARQLEVARVVHTSTSETYGTACYVPIDEKHPLQGQSPYAATKIGADKLAEAFYCSFGLPVITVRPFNTYGPRQSVRAVIPTIILQCLAGKRVKLGALHPTRDLNFVGNTVAGFIAAAAAPRKALGRVVNLGSGREISVGDLAGLIAGMMDCHPKIECERRRLRPGPSEVERLLADGRLARALLGWEPAVSLEDGLRQTIAWFADNRALYHSGNYAL